jgi:ribose transport system permease protein
MQAALRNLSFGRIGVIYVWAVIIIIFSILVPDLFPELGTARAIVNGYSIAGLAALAVLPPLVSGAFDASIGGNISLSSVVCAQLFIKTDLPIGVIIPLTLGVGLLIGLANVIAVVILQIPSLIGTLAVWLIADAVSVAVSGNTTISGPRISGDFGSYLSNATFQGVTIKFLFVLILMVILGVVLSHTTAGRYTHAVGFDPEVSRLAGVRVKSIQAYSLLAAGLMGSFTGIVLTSNIGSSAPKIGDSYLLPAFAAVFLGATQFKAKRFNAIGTVVAVFMLATGQYGLQLEGAPPWAPDVFQGVALITAIGFTQVGKTLRFRRRVARSSGPALDPDTPDEPDPALPDLHPAQAEVAPAP